MITPKWVRRRSTPIALENVLTYTIAAVGRQREQPEHREESHLPKEGRPLDALEVGELLRTGQVGEGAGVRVRFGDRMLKCGEISAESVGLVGIQPSMDMIHEVHHPGFAGARCGPARDDLRGDGLDVAGLGVREQLEFPGGVAGGGGVGVLGGHSATFRSRAASSCPQVPSSCS
jgi:hypothetical protein